MLIAHRIALDPTNVQRSYFLRASGVARFSWNWALAQWRRQYEARQADPSVPAPTDAALRRDLNRRKRAEFPWMYDVTKCASQEAVIDLGMAFGAFFAKRARYPRFKRRDGRARFCAANEAGTFRVQGRRLRLPVVGWVRMREELRFFGVAKRVTVSREGDRWFASVAVETEAVQPVEQPGDAVGVDLGVKTLAVLSFGGEYPRPEGAQAASGRAQVAQPGAVAQAQGLGQPQEGEGASRPPSRPHRQYPPGCDAQGDDAYRQGLAAHRRRGPQRARHGGQPSAGALDHGRRLPRVPPPVGLQGNDVRRDGDCRRSLVSLEQDLFVEQHEICPVLDTNPVRTGAIAQ